MTKTCFKKRPRQGRMSPLQLVEEDVVTKSTKEEKFKRNNSEALPMILGGSGESYGVSL